MKFTEAEQNKDRTKLYQTWAKPGWLFNLILRYRDWRCKRGYHQMKNHWGELLENCKWCDE